MDARLRRPICFQLDRGVVDTIYYLHWTPFSVEMRTGVVTSAGAGLLGSAISLGGRFSFECDSSVL